MSIINILSCLVQCALHFACKLVKCFRAYTIFNDCFFSSCFSTLKRFPIGFKSGLAKLLQSIRQQVAEIAETLHFLGALLISYYLSHCSPPPPLISVASETNKCWELKQSTLKGGEGRGSGKGLNSRYAEYWKLEKVFFNESVSTILQLVVAWTLVVFVRTSLRSVRTAMTSGQYSPVRPSRSVSKKLLQAPVV